MDVKILDSTGRQPYRDDVYITRERIVCVGSFAEVDRLRLDSKVQVIQGRGRTLMGTDTLT
jgi:predicted amidohydrolase YtcJ